MLLHLRKHTKLPQFCCRGHTLHTKRCTRIISESRGFAYAELQAAHRVSEAQRLKLERQNWRKNGELMRLQAHLVLSRALVHLKGICNLQLVQSWQCKTAQHKLQAVRRAACLVLCSVQQMGNRHSCMNSLQSVVWRWFQRYSRVVSATERFRAFRRNVQVVANT